MSRRSARGSSRAGRQPGPVPGRGRARPAAGPGSHLSHPGRPRPVRIRAGCAGLTPRSPARRERTAGTRSQGSWPADADEQEQRRYLGRYRAEQQRAAGPAEPAPPGRGSGPAPPGLQGPSGGGPRDHRPCRHVLARDAVSLNAIAEGGADMRLSWADEDLAVSFVPGDERRRLEFGRHLACYVRRHRERWDITAVLEPLQLLAAKTGQVNVHLHRSPPGRLAVTIQFELEPVGAAGGLGLLSARRRCRRYPHRR